MDKEIAKKCAPYGRAVGVLKKLLKDHPQFNIDGERNIWIVKPAGSSRGRGIVLYKNLVEI
jgi:tubulin monoglycylase TTLL3/8